MTLVADDGDETFRKTNPVIDLASSTAEDSEGEAQQDEVPYPRYTLSEGTAEPHNPLTWGWLDLFELYVFADKYSTRGLRLRVFDIIQIKLVRNDSITQSSLPEALEYLTGNLPKDSKLVDMFARKYRFFTPAWYEISQDYLSTFPASFLARALMHTARYRAATACDACKRGEPAAPCVGHTKDDLKSLRRLPSCIFHEHGDDEEESTACAAAWKARIALIPRA